MVKVGANIDLTDEHVSRIHLLSSPQETAFLFPQDGTQRRMFSPPDMTGHERHPQQQAAIL